MSNSFIYSAPESPDKPEEPIAQEPEQSGFLSLFYQVLFLPSQAAEQIKLLREKHSSKLFFYALGSLLLAGLGFSASQQSLNILIPSVFIWFATVLLFAFLGWVFRPQNIELDLGLLFFFCAFAQAPLVFLGLSKLWENSIFPTTGPTILCLIWSMILWGWALVHSLQISVFKSIILVFLALMAPFIRFYSYRAKLLSKLNFYEKSTPANYFFTRLGAYYWLVWELAPVSKT